MLRAFLRSSFRVKLALSCFLIGYFTITPLHLLWVLNPPLIIRVLSERPGAGTEYRNRLSRWRSYWSRTYLRMISFFVKLKVDIQLEHLSVPDQVIVISNHRSFLDILVVKAALHEVGIDHTRWVQKRALSRVPILGWVCRQERHAFVGRDGNPEDKRIMEQFARNAETDHASPVIFPGGTRFVRPKEGSGFTHVRPPRAGGFTIITRECSSLPILSLTLDWQGVAGGKTILDGDAFMGKTVVVTGTLKKNPFVTGPIAFLNEDFQEKDRLLSRSAV